MLKLVQTPMPFDTNPNHKYHQIQYIIYKNTTLKIIYKWNTLAQKYSAQLTSYNGKKTYFNMMLTPHSQFLKAKNPDTSTEMFQFYIYTNTIGNLKGDILSFKYDS